MAARRAESDLRLRDRKLREPHGAAASGARRHDGRRRHADRHAVADGAQHHVGTSVALQPDRHRPRHGRDRAVLPMNVPFGAHDFELVAFRLSIALAALMTVAVIVERAAFAFTQMRLRYIERRYA